MKIIVDYDKSSGNVLFECGYNVIALGGMDYKEAKENGIIDALVKLKNAGFSADEIIELKRKEVI